MRKSHISIIALFVITIFYTIIQQMGFGDILHPHYDLSVLNIKQINNSTKTILYWNNFFAMKHFGFGVGMDPFKKAGCAETNCLLWDKEDGYPDLPIEEFDAIFFHVTDTSSESLSRNRPAIRLPHQRYIFFTLESPVMRTNTFKQLVGFFNWTLTYRKDSDLYFPYGWIGNKTTLTAAELPSTVLPTWPEPTNKSRYILKTTATKRRLVAWLVSNCDSQSRRGEYVSELSKYIKIDIYGKCGKLKCSNSRQCDLMMEETYKFYLSFENSLCEDYVTEKFFRAMEYEIVPVVYGGVDYKHIAPPHSYIDIKDFANPKELATYLLYLDKNPDEYEKYFWWKSQYSINRSNKHVLCQLCAKLNNPNEQRKIYTDIDRWWRKPNVCHEPNFTTLRQTK